MCACQTWHYASQHAYLNIWIIKRSPQTQTVYVKTPSLLCMWRLVLRISTFFSVQVSCQFRTPWMEIKPAHYIFMVCTFLLVWQKNFSGFLQLCLLWFLLSISESYFFPFDGETFHGWNGNVFESQMFMEIACFHNIHTASLLLFLKLPCDFYTTIQLHFIVFWNQHQNSFQAIYTLYITRLYTIHSQKKKLSLGHYPLKRI